MTARGFLLLLTDPPADFEEEFNAWYDTEHLPERLAVPGFLTARRFVRVGGGAPRYLTIYDLESPAVMESEAYRRVAYGNSSPWTQRVTTRCRPQRFRGEQLGPGRAVTARAARLLVLRWRGLDGAGLAAAAAGMATCYGAAPAVLQHRILRDAEGEVAIGVVEACAPIAEALDPAAFGPAAPALDLIATYEPW